MPVILWQIVVYLYWILNSNLALQAVPFLLLSILTNIGVIPKSAQQHLDIEFVPDSLGPFEVAYDVLVKGASYPVKLTFKGEMLGPTFVCDVEHIDYGKVSYSFSYTRSLKISNTSEIPMRYTIKPYVDDILSTNEFVLDPSTSSIPPYQSQEIKVTFTPASIKKYSNVKLVLDVACVGESVLTIPVFAECVCASVKYVNSFFLIL